MERSRFAAGALSCGWCESVVVHANMSSLYLAPDCENEKCEVASVSCLPNELLLRVLVHLDGASLVRCARVCSRWREVVALILERGHVDWEVLCRSEIDAEVLHEMVGHRSSGKEPAGPEALEMDWYAVYKRWYSTRAVSQYPHIVQTAQDRIVSPVTCVKATGDLVVTGHQDGGIIYWHGRSGYIAMEYSGCNAAINDMVLVDPHGSVSRPWYGGIKVLHSTLVYATDEPRIQARQLDMNSKHILSKQTGYPVTSMRVCGDLLAALCQMRCAVLVLQLVFEGSTLVAFRTLMRVPNSLGACSWIGISGESVTHVGPKGMAGSIGFTDDKWERWPLPQVHCYGPVRVSLALMQRNGLLIVATENAGLYVSVDNGRRGLWPVRGLSRWKSRASALALCGTVLAVGLECGRLCLYRLRDKSALPDLEYKQWPDWSEQLSSDALVSVDITSNPVTMLPVVVTCTSEELFTVHWPFQN